MTELKNNARLLKTAVSGSAFVEGDKVMAFDNQDWIKVGDVGDNSCFYKEAKILSIYFHRPKLYGSSDWCANVQFNDGRMSNGHFLSGLRHCH
ncbi:MAG: hypothetical protein RL308_3084 [Bacteroidota bacterium]|jgi:hypothetical protein